MMCTASMSAAACGPCNAADFSKFLKPATKVQAFAVGTCQSFKFSSSFHPGLSLPSSNESTLHGRVKPSRTGQLSVRAATGFGGSGKKSGQVLTKDKDLAGWTQVASADEVEEGKNKAVIVKGKGYVVAKQGGAIFGIGANCPACQFPLIKGKVEVKEAVEIQCPLCHSAFSLADGMVKAWCPKDGVVTFVIGTLKNAATPENASVYKGAQSESGQVYLQLQRST